jgi:hypothetical protein
MESEIWSWLVFMKDLLIVFIDVLSFVVTNAFATIHTVVISWLGALI